MEFDFIRKRGNNMLEMLEEKHKELIRYAKILQTTSNICNGRCYTTRIFQYGERIILSTMLNGEVIHITDVTTIYNKGGE